MLNVIIQHWHSTIPQRWSLLYAWALHFFPLSFGLYIPRECLCFFLLFIPQFILMYIVQAILRTHTNIKSHAHAKLSPEKKYTKEINSFVFHKVTSRNTETEDHQMESTESIEQQKRTVLFNVSTFSSHNIHKVWTEHTKHSAFLPAIAYIRSKDWVHVAQLRGSVFFVKTNWEFIFWNYSAIQIHIESSVL